MKRFLAPMLSAIICLSLAACGQSEFPENGTSSQGTSSASPTLDVTAEAICIPVGDRIDNENFTMTFDSVAILDEYSFDNRIFKPDNTDGYKLLLVKGHFENKFTEFITIYDFYLDGVVVNDSYDFGNAVGMAFELWNDTQIAPLDDADYFLRVEIPEKLANQFEKVEFTLGFNNDMSDCWLKSANEIDNLYTISG